jgi:hypothetical protein
MFWTAKLLQQQLRSFAVQNDLDCLFVISLKVSID